MDRRRPEIETQMSEAAEPNPQVSESSETQPSNAPADYAGYVKWRQTGEPAGGAEENTPAAAAETPQAKTEPQSGADEGKQQEEEEEKESGEEEPEPAESGRRGQRQRRIDRLTKEVAELRAMLAASPPAAPPETPKPAATPADRPRFSDFATLEEYTIALADWTADQRELKRQAEATQKAAEAARKAAEAEQERLVAAWPGKIAAVRKLHADYDDVADSIQDPQGPGVEPARQALLEDEHGAEILYWLGKHPDEIARIAALNPNAAVREIGRLSAILHPPSTAANGKQRFTAAPKPPPSSTRPAQISSDSINDPDVQKDFRKWFKARQAQLKDR